jgi:hypothetical protein
MDRLILEAVAKAILDASMAYLGRSWPRWEDGATGGAKDEARALADAAIAAYESAKATDADPFGRTAADLRENEEAIAASLSGAQATEPRNDALSLWRITQTKAYQTAQADKQVRVLKAAMEVYAARARAEERERFVVVLEPFVALADSYDTAYETRCRMAHDEGRAPGSPLSDGHRVSISLGEARAVRAAIRNLS